MGFKQKDFMSFIGLSEEDYDPDKERLILMIEESDNDEEFIVQIFDISKDEKEISLIKEIGYGVLQNLYDEEFVNAIRDSGKYAFNAKYPSSPEFEFEHGENVIEFKKLH